MNLSMKILVTGSSGFIGKKVCEIFRGRGDVVVGIDINSLDLKNEYKCDVLDKDKIIDIFKNEQPDIVIHLAARCDLGGKTNLDYDTNISGVHNICSAIEVTSSVKRAIFTSSQLVCRVGYIPSNDHDYCPDTQYGESKVVTESIVRERNGGNVTWCIVRPTTVWGPGMSAHYKSLLRYIENGKYFHSGYSELMKSYAYIDNIGHQYMKIAGAKAYHIDQKTFYLADYEPLSLRDYINRISHELGVSCPKTLPLSVAKTIALIGDLANLFGLNFPFNSFRLKNILTEYLFDLSDTKRVCGELPKSFIQGISETVKWYKQCK